MHEGREFYLLGAPPCPDVPNIPDTQGELHTKQGDCRTSRGDIISSTVFQEQKERGRSLCWAHILCRHQASSVPDAEYFSAETRAWHGNTRCLWMMIVWWAGTDFSSQDNLTESSRNYVPQAHTTLTKIRIPGESDSWEIKSRLHQTRTVWPWASYLIFLSVHCETEIIITS